MHKLQFSPAVSFRSFRFFFVFVWNSLLFSFIIIFSTSFYVSFDSFVFVLVDSADAFVERTNSVLIFNLHCCLFSECREHNRSAQKQEANDDVGRQRKDQTHRAEQQLGCENAISIHLFYLHFVLANSHFRFVEAAHDRCRSSILFFLCSFFLFFFASFASAIDSISLSKRILRWIRESPQKANDERKKCEWNYKNDIHEVIIYCVFEAI